MFPIAQASSPPPAETFVERWAPRPPTVPALPDPATAVAPSPRRRGQDDLLARYLGSDLRPLIADAEARPAHYGRRQLDVLTRLRSGHRTTAGERAGLLLHFMRRTEAAALEQRTRQAVTARTTVPEKAPPPFETQSLFQGAITII